MINQSARYFIPDPSTWPITGSIALLCLASGAASWFNGWSPGKFLVLAGFAILTYMIVGWFHTVAHESETGKYNKQVDLSFRWGMSWFIFSEVMFFAAFFGALFYMRVLSVPELGDLEHKLIWPDFTSAWPATGPGMRESFSPMGAWGIPAINTLLLLTSGVTVTLAHWALLRNDRLKLIAWMFATVGLGITEADGSWAAVIPDLPGCVGAGDSTTEALEMLDDAKLGWITSRLKHGDPIPEPSHVPEPQ